MYRSQSNQTEPRDNNSQRNGKKLNGDFAQQWQKNKI